MAQGQGLFFFFYITLSFVQKKVRFCAQKSMRWMRFNQAYLAPNDKALVVVKIACGSGKAVRTKDCGVFVWPSRKCLLQRQRL